MRVVEDDFIFASMRSTLSNLEPGRPARAGQLILERRHRIFSRYLAREPGCENLLDIGCGNGAQTAYFADNAEHIVGFDIVHPRDSECPAKIPAFDFIRGSSQTLPFKNETFDCVTAFEVLEHLPDDLIALQEIFRVSKPGGLLLVSVPNKWWILETHGARIPGLNWIPWNRFPFLSWLPEKLHDKIACARIYTMKKALKLVAEAGFSILHSGYITAPLDVLSDSPFKRMMHRTIFRHDTTANPVLAVNLFIAARKD